MINPQKPGGNFFVNLVRGSVILTSLDRFAAYIYTLLKTGFFGWIFTGYPVRTQSRVFGRIREGRFGQWLECRRRSVCRRIDSSLILNFVPYAMRFFLGCRLRVYGAFLASFGLYTAVVTAVSLILSGRLDTLLEHPYIQVSVVMICASLPLILSKITMAEAIGSSFCGKAVLAVTGYSQSDLTRTEGSGGHMNTAFLFGIICGALTYRISPAWILMSLAALVWAYLTLIRPEIGVLTLFAAVPWMPTMVLAAIVIYTALCWLIKLFRGKRIFRIEPVDVMAAAFALIMAFGGIVSLSPQSLKPALLMTCLLMGYFLTVGLIRSREWLVRCSVVTVLSGTLQSLWAIFLHFTGGGYSSDAWLDEEMFGEIAGRAVGSLDNPNMLGEYLVLVIPIAVGMFIGRGEGMRRTSSFLCIGVMGVCLILTWSRGAWLGLMFAALVFLFMWHHRSMWLVLAGIAAIPMLPYILPQSIISRFSSIGDLTDSSTSYRVHIWHSSVAMIADHPFTGIGVGEGAWRQLYPLYTYMGVEQAPHSHNLYLQIWLETGLSGILVFLLFLFFLYQSGFTMFRRLGSRDGLQTPDLSPSMLRFNLESGDTDPVLGIQRGRTQLRLTAAAPLCSIAGVLLQGMTDYAWYNYRLYLMFWLICGLASAYIRSGYDRIGASPAVHADTTSCDVSVPLETASRKKPADPQTTKRRKSK